MTEKQQEKVKVCKKSPPEKNYRSEKSRQVKNGGAEGGGRCESEFQEEAGEESTKVSWTLGKNGRGTLDEESVWAQSGGKKEKTEI